MEGIMIIDGSGDSEAMRWRAFEGVHPCRQDLVPRRIRPSGMPKVPVLIHCRVIYLDAGASVLCCVGRYAFRPCQLDRARYIFARTGTKHREQGRWKEGKPERTESVEKGVTRMPILAIHISWNTSLFLGEEDLFI